MSKNIVVISEDNSILEFLFSKVSVLKRDETWSCVSLGEMKAALKKDIPVVLINSCDYSNEEIYQMLNIINRLSPESKTIILSNNIESGFVSKCLEFGAFDFIDMNSVSDMFNVRILNCLKFITNIKKYEIISAFINSTNCITPGTGFFTYKSLKECFGDLIEYKYFQNGYFVILTLDDSIKTKISMCRLAQTIKNTLRQTDVVAQGSGKFYLLLSDTDLNGAKIVVEKLAYGMGSDAIIHSGIAEINRQMFKDVEKNATDCLKFSISENNLYTCFEEKFVSPQISGDEKQCKQFKLFKKAYERKLTSVIEPIFFRNEKSFGAKLQNVEITQYVNPDESLFSMKKKNLQSKLIIRSDGMSKINLEITHKGLDTPETTQVSIPLSKLDNALLSKYLKQLYWEFCMS